MKLSVVAKTSLWASLWIVQGITQAWGVPKRVPSVPPPDLECGLYRAQGVVQTNRHGHFVLVIHFDTPSPFEVRILGGDLKKRIERLGLVTTIQFYVPNPFRKNPKQSVYLQKFEALERENEDYVELLEKLPCGDRRRYVEIK